MKGRDVAPILRKVAALRNLVLRLPHLETPAEAQRLLRFDALVESPRSVTSDDIDALVSGWSRWWRTGRTKQLLAMAESLSGGVVAQDRRLQTFLTAARATAAR